MDDNDKIPYSKIINGHYYFYLRIPTDIQQYFPENFIRRTLKTKDPDLARRRIAEWEQKVFPIFYMLRDTKVELSEEYKHSLVNNTFYSHKDKKTTRTKKGVMKFSAIIQHYLDKGDLNKKWRPKSREGLVYALNLACEIIGDKPFHLLDTDDIEHFKETCQKLPLHATKKKEYQGKSTQELIIYVEQRNKEIAEWNKANPDIPKIPIDYLSNKTIKEHLGKLSSLIIYVNAKDLTPYPVKNPIAYIKSEMPQNVRADKQRDPYSSEELQRLFNVIHFRPEWPSIFWGSLLMVFQGCRENEVCQLEPKDIFIEDGLWCVHFNEDVTVLEDKHMKTLTSARTIPLHPFLISMGLIKYVEYAKKNKYSLLFNELKAHRGEYSHKFTRRYGEHYTFKLFDAAERRRRGKGRYPTAYSLRHNFISLAFVKIVNRSDVLGVLISAFVGHDVPAHYINPMTVSRYNKPFPPQTLKLVLEFIDYEYNFDLSSIREQAIKALKSIGEELPTQIVQKGMYDTPTPDRKLILDFNDDQSSDVVVIHNNIDEEVLKEYERIIMESDTQDKG